MTNNKIRNIFNELANASFSGKIYKMPPLTADEKLSLEKKILNFWEMAVYALEYGAITEETFDIHRNVYERMRVSAGMIEDYEEEEG